MYRGSYSQTPFEQLRAGKTNRGLDEAARQAFGRTRHRRTIPVRVREQLNTHTAKVGGIFHDVTAAAVYQSDVVLILAKAPVSGRVVLSKSARPFVGYAQLSLGLIAIRLPVPQVGDKTLALATLPLNGSRSRKEHGSGSLLGQLCRRERPDLKWTLRGTLIIVQPDTGWSSLQPALCLLRFSS